MKAVLLFFALIFAPFSREGISLDGEWPAIMDQYDKGIDKKMFTDAKPAGKTSFVEFSSAATISVLSAKAVNIPD